MYFLASEDNDRPQSIWLTSFITHHKTNAFQSVEEASKQVVSRKDQEKMKQSTALRLEDSSRSASLMKERPRSNRHSTESHFDPESSVTSTTTRRRRNTCFGSTPPVGLSLLLLCFFSTWLEPGASFQSNRHLAFGHQQQKLFLVEPKERTKQTTGRVSEIPIGTGEEPQLGSYVISASADEQREETDDESQEEYANEQEDSIEDDEVKAERLAKAAKAAKLLSRRTGNKPSGKVNSKSTSVGARRIGSASQARAGSRSMARITDAMKKAALANTAPRKQNDKPDPSDRDGDGPSAAISMALIQSTVESMIQASASMGLLGEAHYSTAALDPNSWQVPAPGTVLMQAERSTKPWRPADRISVRVATLADDLDIASLRLSVFSDFSPDMRKAFCAKSCQVLSSRRNRGATCIVATVPRYGSIMSQRPDIILGTAECSFHEFEGTSLGRQRPIASILYITEVAVSPTARRKGIGQKIMQVRPFFWTGSLAACRMQHLKFHISCIQSIEKLAKMRGVETLFLHVDVINFGALSLYGRSGYKQVPVNDPRYQEFTRSLNLHDGATKGRNHYLLQKDVLPLTWLPETNNIEAPKGTLGFEIAV